MDYQKLSQQFQTKLTRALETQYGSYQENKLEQMFSSLSERGMQLWKTEIVPELGREPLTQFEIALDGIQMRARQAVPWLMVSGYSYGRAISALAGEKHKPVSVNRAAAICGLGMLIVAIFDRLLDVYPEQFADAGERLTTGLLDQMFEGRELTWDEAKTPLAGGLLKLLGTYIQMNQEASDSAGLKSQWQQAIRHALVSELDTTGFRRSATGREQVSLAALEAPSQGMYQYLALGVCLHLENPDIDKVLGFADAMARFTWYLDDAVDLAEDWEQDRWSGLISRLNESATEQETLSDTYAHECVSLYGDIRKQLSGNKWQQSDGFELADVFLGHAYRWLMGPQASH